MCTRSYGLSTNLLDWYYLYFSLVFHISSITPVFCFHSLLFYFFNLFLLLIFFYLLSPFLSSLNLSHKSGPWFSPPSQLSPICPDFTFFHPLLVLNLFPALSFFHSCWARSFSPDKQCCGRAGHESIFFRRIGVNAHIGLQFRTSANASIYRFFPRHRRLCIKASRMNICPTVCLCQPNFIVFITIINVLQDNYRYLIRKVKYWSLEAV